MGKYLLRLSWPSQPLWENRPCHWTRRAEAKKAARKEAWAAAREHSIKADPRAHLEFQFHPPDKRKRDLHNMPATQKAYIDGIADAMGSDDHRFKVIWPTEFSDVVKGGCVLITITTGDETSG